MIRPPPRSTLFPYTTLSRSASPADRAFSPPRAVIMAVNPDGSRLRVVERGVRNGEGLAVAPDGTVWTAVNNPDNRSEEHTSELQSPCNLVCRLLLEKNTQKRYRSEYRPLYSLSLRFRIAISLDLMSPDDHPSSEVATAQIPMCPSKGSARDRCAGHS